MIKIKRKSLWKPDYAADSIFEIDAAELKEIGITHLVFDLDNTLLTRRTPALSPETVRFIATLRRTGLKIVLGSNTWRSTDQIVQTMDAHAVRVKGLMMKPRRAYYERVIRSCGVPPEQIAMAGDHLLNDVIGANRAGLTSILVKSLSRRPLTCNSAYMQYLRKYG